MSAAVDPQLVEPQELIPLTDYEFLGDNDTVSRKCAFIEAYRSEGSIYHAALTARISRKTIYRWLELDAQFAEAVEESKEDCYDQAETSVFRKALAGDSLLLMFYLKAHRHKFRDKVTVDIQAIDEEIKERLKQVNASNLNSSNSTQLPRPPVDLQKEPLQLSSSTDPDPTSNPHQ